MANNKKETNYGLVAIALINPWWGCYQIQEGTKEGKEISQSIRNILNINVDR